MKDIFWVEVIERQTGTESDIKIIESYPFPDIPESLVNSIVLDNIPAFKSCLNKIENPQQRLASQNRFHFILEIWHPNKFILISIKPWKYS